MQTIPKRILALVSVVALVLTGCSPGDSQPEKTIAALDVQLVWPQASSSLATLADTVPSVNRPQSKARPTASTAKVITALAVLAKHPLAAGNEGPVVVLGPEDVTLANDYAASSGTYLPVYEGMNMTVQAMLEAMLLPSANNIADTLAIWAFGSMGAYRQAATSLVESLGMRSTTIGSDASGYDPSTTSTAGDLALLARAAMKSPVIAQIAGLESAVIPGYGPVTNTNTLLGTQGIVGLKTGTSPQAGGVFLFAANATIKGRQTVVVGAVMGAGDSSADAMRETEGLLKSLRAAPATSPVKPVAVGP
ncbi:D-alanyl-D-alanine carboxypeptidase family protein [Arthrobacter sp. HLT1-20]